MDVTKWINQVKDSNLSSDNFYLIFSVEEFFICIFYKFKVSSTPLVAMNKSEIIE